MPLRTLPSARRIPSRAPRVPLPVVARPVARRVAARAAGGTASLALALLAACGEGPTATGDRRPDAAVAPAEAATVVGCTGTRVTLTGDEAAALARHAAEREARQLPALCVHPALVAAARAHSADMLARGYFAHVAPDGRGIGARVTAAGYADWTLVAENLAWGSGTRGAADAVFAAWLDSETHRRTLHDARLREVGIGVATGSFAGYAGVRMYTVDFGTR